MLPVHAREAAGDERAEGVQQARRDAAAFAARLLHILAIQHRQAPEAEAACNRCEVKLMPLLQGGCAVSNEHGAPSLAAARSLGGSEVQRLTDLPVASLAPAKAVYPRHPWIQHGCVVAQRALYLPARNLYMASSRSDERELIQNTAQLRVCTAIKILRDVCNWVTSSGRNSR